MNGENQHEAPLSSKTKPRTHIVPSSKVNSFEKIPTQEIIYPKISLSEILSNPQKCFETNISMKKLIIQSFKRFDNLAMRPDERRHLWMILTAGDQNAQEINELYHDILRVLESYPKNFARLIELDITRTFKPTLTPNEISSSNTGLQANLREVLNCYSCRNPYIGYCQGLNFIVGELLRLGFSNQEGFWVLGYMLEVALPVDYYTSMISLMVDQRVFSELISLHLCELNDKFKEVGLEPSIFSLQWFVCLFACTVEQEVLHVIWDFLLVKGNKIFHKIGLALLLLIQNELMKAQDFGELLLKIEEKIKEIKDVRLFQKTVLDLKIPKKMIQDLTAKHLADIKKEVQARLNATKDLKISTPGGSVRENLLLQKKGTLNEEKCNPTSPICMKTLEKNKMRKKKQSFLIFRQGFSPHIIQNYMEDYNKIKEEGKSPEGGKWRNSRKTIEEINNEETLKLMQKPENAVLIGRVHHICFKKLLASRQARKKDEPPFENAALSQDEKVKSPGLKEPVNQRSSSVSKNKGKEGREKTKKKFSDKVHKSKDFLINLFKGSFCMAQQREPSLANVEIKPRIIDFESFHLKRPNMNEGKSESVIIADLKKSEHYLFDELHTEGDVLYENGIGLTTLSPLMNSHFYEKFREKLDRKLFEIMAHDLNIESLLADKSEQSILTSSRDHLIRLWALPLNSEQGLHLRQEFPHHRGSVISLKPLPSFHKPSFFLSTSTDETLKIWDLEEKKCIKTIKTFGVVSSLALCEKKIAAAFGRDSLYAIKILDLVSGNVLSELKGHKDVILSLVASQKYQKLISASRDKSLRLWDLKSRKFLQKPMKTIEKAHKFGITSLIFNENTDILVSGGNDHLIKVWAFSDSSLSLTLLRSLSLNRSWILQMIPLSNHLMVSTSADDTIKLWNVKTGACLESVEEPGVFNPGSMVFLEKRKILVVGDKYGCVRGWEISGIDMI